MSTKVRLIILGVVVAVVAFLLEPNSPLGGFWAPADDMPEPSGGQVPLFIVLGLVEAIALGVGAAFIAWAFTRVPAIASSIGTSVSSTRWALVAVGWLLTNWWVHDSLHINNGNNLDGLLVIEYLFHVTLIAGGVYLAWFFTRAVMAGRRASA
jgi:hypothetical protein